MDLHVLQDRFPTVQHQKKITYITTSASSKTLPRTLKTPWQNNSSRTPKFHVSLGVFCSFYTQAFANGLSEYSKRKGGHKMNDLEKLMKKIEADPQNAKYTKEGIAPLFSAPRKAKILIVRASTWD